MAIKLILQGFILIYKRLCVYIEITETLLDQPLHSYLRLLVNNHYWISHECSKKACTTALSWKNHWNLELHNNKSYCTHEKFNNGCLPKCISSCAVVDIEGFLLFLQQSLLETRIKPCSISLTLAMHLSL